MLQSRIGRPLGLLGRRHVAHDATPEGWAVSASDPLMRSAQARGGAAASPEELAGPGWVSEEFGQIDLPDQANEQPDPGGGLGVTSPQPAVCPCLDASMPQGDARESLRRSVAVVSVVSDINKINVK